MNRSFWILTFSLTIASTYGQSKGVELSHYIFPEFTTGTILIKSGQEHKALLNYNSYTEEMIFDEKGVKLAIGKDEKELVDTVYIMNRKFFTLNGRFVELIYRSEFELYAEYRCDTPPVGGQAFS